MSVRSVIDRDPCKNHDAIGNSAQLSMEGIGAIVFFDFRDGHQSTLDRLQKVLEHSGLVATGEIRLLGLGGDEKKSTLLFEALENLGSLDKKWSR